VVAGDKMHGDFFDNVDEEDYDDEEQLDDDDDARGDFIDDDDDEEEDIDGDDDLELLKRARRDPSFSTTTTTTAAATANASCTTSSSSSSSTTTTAEASTNLSQSIATPSTSQPLAQFPTATMATALGPPIPISIDTDTDSDTDNDQYISHHHHNIQTASAPRESSAVEDIRQALFYNQQYQAFIREQLKRIEAAQLRNQELQVCLCVIETTGVTMHRVARHSSLVTD
jgi:hypothetical protein